MNDAPFGPHANWSVSLKPSARVQKSTASAHDGTTYSTWPMPTSSVRNPDTPAGDVNANSSVCGPQNSSCGLPKGSSKRANACTPRATRSGPSSTFTDTPHASTDATASANDAGSASSQPAYAQPSTSPGCTANRHE